MYQRANALIPLQLSYLKVFIHVTTPLSLTPICRSARAVYKYLHYGRPTPSFFVRSWGEYLGMGRISLRCFIGIQVHSRRPKFFLSKAVSSHQDGLPKSRAGHPHCYRCEFQQFAFTPLQIGVNRDISRGSAFIGPRIVSQAATF
jgi:hypothetical protein